MICNSTLHLRRSNCTLHVRHLALCTYAFTIALCTYATLHFALTPPCTLHLRPLAICTYAFPIALCTDALPSGLFTYAFPIALCSDALPSALCTYATLRFAFTHPCTLQSRLCNCTLHFPAFHKKRKLHLRLDLPHATESFSPFQEDSLYKWK